MSFAGLSAVGPGMQTGQMNLQTLQAKAQQIQQAQMAIDASKRELQAQAALFQGLPAGAQPPGNASPGQSPGGQAPMGGQQMPQPPMPGQPSQLMGMPQQGGQQTPMGRPPGGMPPPGQQGGQTQPQGPQGGQQMPGQQPGAGGQDLSPQAQMQLLTQIAQGIKQRSPGIDPLTLFEAVKQQIGLMTALSNTQKQQLVFAADQIKAQVQTRGQDVRAQTQEDTTDKRVGATERGQDIGARNTDVRVKGMLQATQARIADADNRLQQTQQAISGRQDKSISGRAAAKVQTERLTLLKTELSQAKQKLSAAAASGDATATAQAQSDVDASYKRVLDFQKKVVGGQASPPPGAGATDPSQNGPTATDAKGNKVMWNGQAWVPAVGQ